jgi:hypothetical protein
MNAPNRTNAGAIVRPGRITPYAGGGYLSHDLAARPRSCHASSRDSSPRRLIPGARTGVLFLVAVLAFTSACAGTSPDRVAYNSIDGAVSAVQTSLAAFNDLYQVGVKTDPVTWNDRRTKAKDAYEKFQATALAAAKLSQQVLDPQHRTSIVEMVSTAAAEALRIIQAFNGGK